MHPRVMQNGRILYPMCADHMNIPSLYTKGLQPLETDSNFGPRFFEPWSCHPDVAGTDRLVYMASRLDQGSGGGMHFRKMLNG